MYSLVLTEVSLGTGRGTTFASFPYLTLNILSRFNTFRWLGLLGGRMGMIDLGKRSFPLNFFIESYPLKGLDHLDIFFYDKLWPISLLSSLLLVLMISFPKTSLWYLLLDNWINLYFIDLIFNLSSLLHWSSTLRSFFLFTITSSVLLV